MQGIRDLLKATSPTWFATGTAEKLVYAFGLATDALIEKLNESMRAPVPGLGDPTASPIIGSEYGIPQGIFESAAGYANRLRFAFDDWARAGSARSIMRQILGYLTPLTPLIRHVSTLSIWDFYPLAADTTQPPTHYSPAVANWNWDGSLAQWWRTFLILYTGLSPVGNGVSAATNAAPIAITTNAAHGLATGNVVSIAGVEGNIAANGTWTITVTGGSSFTLNSSVGNGAYTSGGTVYSVPSTALARPGVAWGSVGAKWGDTNRSWGLDIPYIELQSLRSIVSLWKGAHSWVQWMIFSFNPALYDPTMPSGGGINPDGTWGHWGKSNASGQFVPARDANSRFCDGTT